MVKSLVEVVEKVEEIFGFKIKDYIVCKVMVVEGVDIVEEYYFLIFLDCIKCCYLVMFFKEGGVEIEKFVVECFEVFICCSFFFFDGMIDIFVCDMVYEVGFVEEDVVKFVFVFK